jgi:ABC-type sugar transport system, periplasmic component
MYRSRKVFCLLLALMSVLTLTLAGCGNQGGNSTQTTTERGTSITQTESAAPEPVTISWSYVNYQPQADQQVIEDELNKLLQQKLPNTTVKLEPIDASAYTDKVNMKIAAQEVSDILWVGYLFWLKDAVGKGALAELNTLLDKDAPALKAALPQYVWDMTTIKGKIYAVPNYQSCTSQQGLYIDKALADKYSLTPDSIKSLTDLEPFLQKVKENEPDYYPIRQDGAGVFRRLCGVYPFYPDDVSFSDIGGVGLYYKFNENPIKLYNFFATEEYKGYLKLLRDWFLKGYLRKDIVSVMDDSADYKNGKYAVVAGGIIPGGKLQEEATQGGKELYEIPFRSPIVTPTALLASTNGITSTSKNPDRAIQFMQLVNTDKEVYNLICHGIENTHYTKISDNQYDVIKDSKYNPGTDWVFGNQFNSYILKGNPADLWEQTLKLNDSAIPSPLMGFSFDSTSVTTQLTQINSVLKEYSIIETGTMPDYEKKLAEMLGKLDKAGINDVLTEAQKQVDEFMKTK